MVSNLFVTYRAACLLASCVFSQLFLVQAEVASVSLHSVASDIAHKMRIISARSREIGAKKSTRGAGITYRTSFGTFLSGRLPCVHWVCPSRISYRGIVKLFLYDPCTDSDSKNSTVLFFVKLPHLRGIFCPPFLL